MNFVEGNYICSKQKKSLKVLSNDSDLCLPSLSGREIEVCIINPTIFSIILRFLYKDAKTDKIPIFEFVILTFQIVILTFQMVIPEFQIVIREFQMVIWGYQMIIREFQRTFKGV